MNHDCVLTLDEFSAIIRQRKPHFSDRRVLRMFREALMGGIDQSFALSMEAFVVVCNDHGLVSLLPDDQMADPFTSTESVPDTSRHTKGLAPKNSIGAASPATDTTDSSVSVVVVEIPENISWGDSALSSARAHEVDDDEEHTGWEQSESDSEM